MARFSGVETTGALKVERIESYGELIHVIIHETEGGKTPFPNYLLFHNILRNGSTQYD